MEIHFDRERVIDRVDVFSLQDDYRNPVEPTLATTFTVYGLVDFNVSYFDSATGQWVLLSAIRNNNLVWRQLYFEPVMTQKLSIAVINCLSLPNAKRWSRIVEVEAWGSLAMQPQLPPAAALAIGHAQPLRRAWGRALPHDRQPARRHHESAPHVPGRPPRPEFPLRLAHPPRLGLQRVDSGGSKNKPVLAHALALWRSTNPAFRSEWDLRC